MGCDLWASICPRGHTCPKTQNFNFVHEGGGGPRKGHTAESTRTARKVRSATRTTTSKMQGSEPSEADSRLHGAGKNCSSHTRRKPRLYSLSSSCTSSKAKGAGGGTGARTRPLMRAPAFAMALGLGGKGSNLLFNCCLKRL